MNLLRIILLMAALLATGLHSAAADDVQVVEIGLASNFSEVHEYTFNPFQNSFQNGIAMALDEARPALKKRGIEIVLRNFDYGARAMAVRTAAQEAVASNVVAVIGYSGSNQTLLAAPIHEKHKLLMIAPTSTATKIYSAGQYIVPLAVPNAYQADMMASAAFEHGGTRAVVIHAADRAYATDLAKMFELRFAARGGTVTGAIPILNAQHNFDDVVAALQHIEYDSIVIPNHEFSAARLVAALHAADINTTFIGGDGWESADGKSFFQLVRSPKFRGYFVTDWHPDMEQHDSQRFTKKYRARFTSQPNDESILYYDAMRLLLRGILNAETLTRPAIHKEVRNIRNFAGSTGPVVLAPHTLTHRNAVLVQMNTAAKRLDFVQTLTAERQ